MKKFFVLILMFFTFPCLAGNYARNFLQVVLNNMEENYQHSIGVPLGRYAVYVNKDGREFVYDTVKEKPVEDPVNRGNYNYFPYEMGIKHFIYDRFPWLNLGNSPDDPSSYKDRLFAWIDDFEVSFRKVCREQPTLLQHSKDSFDEKKVFAKMMEKIFSSFLSDARLEKMLSSNPCALITSYEKGDQKGLLYLRKALAKNFTNGPLSDAQMDSYYAKMPRSSNLQ